MADPDFPDELCALIRSCMPSVEAVELLLFVLREPERSWDARTLWRAMQPTAILESAVREYLNGFAAQGLVRREPGDSSYSAAPLTPALQALVAALAKAYNERPVSLVRLIYALKDNKIRSFADAFRLRKG